jgi:hypothetical protein
MEYTPNRRAYISLISTGGAAALAGCSGGDTGESDGSDGSETGGESDGSDGSETGGESETATPTACPDPPNPETSARDLIPDPPEGWELQGTLTDNRKVPPTEEYVIGSFLGPSGGGYNVIISRWSTDGVEDAWTELMNEELAADIDFWMVLGQFAFAAYTPDEEVRIETILAASPALTAECIENTARRRKTGE